MRPMPVAPGHQEWRLVANGFASRKSGSEAIEESRLRGVPDRVAAWIPRIRTSSPTTAPARARYAADTPGASPRSTRESWPMDDPIVSPTVCSESPAATRAARLSRPTGAGRFGPTVRRDPRVAHEWASSKSVDRHCTWTSSTPESSIRSAALPSDVQRTNDLGDQGADGASPGPLTGLDRHAFRTTRRYGSEGPCAAADGSLDGSAQTSPPATDARAGTERA